MMSTAKTSTHKQENEVRDPNLDEVDPLETHPSEHPFTPEQRAIREKVCAKRVEEDQEPPKNVIADDDGIGKKLCKDLKKDLDDSYTMIYLPRPFRDYCFIDLEHNFRVSCDEDGYMVVTHLDLDDLYRYDYPKCFCSRCGYLRDFGMIDK